MELFYILGSFGGIIVLVEEGYAIGRSIVKWYKKYQKMKHYYEKHSKNDNVKLPMGFRTKKEENDLLESKSEEQ